MIFKHVVHVITTIERGGAENAVVALAKAQATLGHKVQVFPLKGAPELAKELEDNGVEVILDGFNKGLLSQVSSLKKILDCDSIVHAHLPRSEIIARLANPNLNLIITRHNSEPFFPAVPLFLSSFLSRWITRNSRVIAISNAVQQFITQKKELHSSAYCKVIYYGYQSKLGQKASITSNVRNHNTIIKIGTVSRLTSQKNLPLLINLSKALLDKGFDIETFIVGGGPLANYLEKMIDEEGLQEKIHLLGRQNDVMVFFENLDLFILPSNYEGFGLVLLEAMDFGLPIIASNTTSIPEVLGANHPGLFEVGNLHKLLEKVTKFVTNPSSRSEYLNYQKPRLSLFSIEKYLTNHEILYESITNS